MFFMYGVQHGRRRGTGVVPSALLAAERRKKLPNSEPALELVDNKACFDGKQMEAKKK